MASVGTNFKKYVQDILKDYKPEPICPFPKGGECWIKDEERECETCEFAKESFIDMKMEQRKRKGAKVFCVVCGASKRTPLRKWNNVYICSDCWKIKERVGEEHFNEILKGRDP